MHAVQLTARPGRPTTAARIHIFVYWHEVAVKGRIGLVALDQDRNPRSALGPAPPVTGAGHLSQAQGSGHPIPSGLAAPRGRFSYAMPVPLDFGNNA